MIFSTSGSERVRIDTSGNVGIGTASPGYKLDVAASGARLGTGGTTNAQFIINGGSSGTAAGAVLSFQANGTGGLAIGNYSGIIGGTYDSTAYLYSGTGNALGFKAGGGTGYQAYINTSGSLGIGTTSPSTQLHVAGASAIARIDRTADASVNPELQLTAVARQFNVGVGGASFATAYIQGAYYIYDATAAAYRFVIDSSGNLLVATTNSTPGNGSGNNVSGFAVNTNGTTWASRDGFEALSVNRVDTTGGVLRAASAGTQVGGISVTSVATVFNTTSDYRLKNVVGAVSDSGSRIDALEPVEYTWKSNGLRTRGFLAHKFQEVYAQSVTGTKDEIDADGNPVYQAMQAGSTEVIADLIAEIQSLRKRLTALEST
jgi:hypothetical protein